MKKLIWFVLPILLWSCEDVIDFDLGEPGPSQLVVDAMLTNQDTLQVVQLSLSQPYFSRAGLVPAQGAEVFVFADDSTRYTFINQGNGRYVYDPKKGGSFDRVGRQYALYVRYQNEEYAAVTSLRRVPKIDSLTYTFTELPFAVNDSSVRSGYLAQFFARDPVGRGDTYWIRFAKNGRYENAPNQINLAYDAGFSPGSQSDGLLFILPIRQSINRGLYVEGDRIRVDLQAIPNEAWFFLSLVRQESGNGGLFAVPSSNIPTNLVNLNADSPAKALGFFAISNVSRFETVVKKENARPNP